MSATASLNSFDTFWNVGPLETKCIYCIYISCGQVTAHAGGDLGFFIKFHIYCQEFKQVRKACPIVEVEV